MLFKVIKAGGIRDSDKVDTLGSDEFDEFVEALVRKLLVLRLSLGWCKKDQDQIGDKHCL